MSKKIHVILSALTIILCTITCLSSQEVPSDFDSFLSPPQDETESSPLGPCEICKLVVKSFEKGIEETSRGKHEGGDTSWEEKNLRNYADSEVRLVEIQERLCEDVTKGKAECLSLSEDAEPDIEHWWFKQRPKSVRLHDYLCISKLKRCCPEHKFGPTCQQCPSECSKHGSCHGSGTRSGTGKCRCHLGYSGHQCDECSDDYFRVATGEHFQCLGCDRSCKGCFGPGRANCTECREGYTRDESNSCIDINECANESQVCTDNTYCVNTDGSFRCSSCHDSCAGCVGYGPNMCIACAPGYKADDMYHCRSLEELKAEEELLGHDSLALIRYLFYIALLVFSVLIFRTNSYLMYILTLGFVMIWIISELDSLYSLEENPRISSE